MIMKNLFLLLLTAPLLTACSSVEPAETLPETISEQAYT